MKITVPTKYNAASPRSPTGTGSATMIVGRPSWVMTRVTNNDVRHAPPPIGEVSRIGLIGVQDIVAAGPTLGPRRFTLRKGRPAYANTQRVPG